MTHQIKGVVYYFCKLCRLVNNLANVQLQKSFSSSKANAE